MLTWQVILCVVMGSPSIMSHQSLLLTSPCGKRPSVFRVSKSCSLSFAGTPCAGKRTVALPVDCVWNVMAHAQKPDFVFRRNGRVHLNRQGRQSSRLLAAEVCASAFIVGSNAGYTMFRGGVKGTGYPLHSPIYPSLPLPCVTMCHHVSAGLYLQRTTHTLNNARPQCSTTPTTRCPNGGRHYVP